MSGNFGFKHQQELPLEIPMWPNDYQALQHLSASLPLLERWQSKSLNTPGMCFISLLFSIWDPNSIICQGCRQRKQRENHRPSEQGLERLLLNLSFAKRYQFSRTSPERET